MLPVEADEAPGRVQRQAEAGRAARVRGRGSELGRRDYCGAAARAAVATRRVRRRDGDKEDSFRLWYEFTRLYTDPIKKFHFYLLPSSSCCI